jgi:hypothetical protein
MMMLSRSLDRRERARQMRADGNGRAAKNYFVHVSMNDADENIFCGGTVMRLYRPFPSVSVRSCNCEFVRRAVTQLTS